MNMNIYVCVGSSCHLKGSYEIINLMKERYFKKIRLTIRWTCQRAFLSGQMLPDGVSIKIDDEIILWHKYGELFGNILISTFFK